MLVHLINNVALDTKDLGFVRIGDDDEVNGVESLVDINEIGLELHANHLDGVENNRLASIKSMSTMYLQQDAGLPIEQMGVEALNCTFNNGIVVILGGGKAIVRLIKNRELFFMKTDNLSEINEFVYKQTNCSLNWMKARDRLKRMIRY